MDLNRFNLTVIGAGALGCAVLPRLLSRGFNAIKIVDGDIVTKPNLKNQPLYSETDAEGMKNKAEAAASYLIKGYPEARLTYHAFYVGENRVSGVIDGADMVLDMTDNAETRLIINDACVKKGVPLLVASVNGKNGFFYTINGKNACFNCIYRNSGMKREGGCANTPIGLVDALGAMVAKEVEGVLASGVKKRKVLFTSISARDKTISRVAITRDPQCETCGLHRYTHRFEGGFIQMCGNGLKFSLQRDLDLAKLSGNLRCPVSKEGGHTLFYKKGARTVLVSDNGDFLFTGYDESEAKQFVFDVLAALL